MPDTLEKQESDAIDVERKALAAERDATGKLRTMESAQATPVAQTVPAPEAPVKADPYVGELMGQERTLFKESQEAMTAEQRAQKAKAEGMKPYYDSAERALREAAEQPIERPKVPTLPSPPQRSQYVDQTVAKSMFAVAALMGGLAMAGGRGRGMLAMAGLRGAMEGFNEGNLERYETGMQTYHEQVNEQIHTYQMQRQDYLDAMTTRNATIEQRLQLVELASMKYGDDITAATAKEKNIDSMFKHLHDFGTTISQMEKASTTNPVKLNSMQYKALMARRAKGELTGDPYVDMTDPKDAATYSGLEKKLSPTQQKQQDQLVGMSHALDEIIALLPEMDEKGFLPKNKNPLANVNAERKRWWNKNDPTLTKWNSLQGTMVGFDRSVFADIGARIKDAYVGSLNLISNPGMLKGMQDTLQGYKHQLETSPEAQRVLKMDPNALQYTPSGKAGEQQSADMVKTPRGTRVSGGILVRRKSDKVEGMLDDESEFDPNVYERIDKATVAPQKGVSGAY